MKKRIIVTVLLLAILMLGAFALSSCSPITGEEAFDILKDAYENSVGVKDGSEWGDIYFYQETVKVNAYIDENGDPVEGEQRSLSVNVHCDYNDDNSYNKDKNYNASINESFSKETIDKTEKTTTVYLGANDIYAVNNKKDVPYLFVTKKTQDLDAKKENAENYAKADVNAKDFTSSEFFKPYTLKSKLDVIKDLTLDDITFVDTKDVKNGYSQVFMTTKLAFKIKEEFFAAHPETRILDGNYVYVEIVDVDLSNATDYRISNLYVYKTEKVGGSDMLKIDYESYKLNISYMGPFISVIDSEEKLENKNPKWTLKDDLFTSGNIDQKYMFSPKI